jgi:4'-phosphopantetheinyl transferase
MFNNIANENDWSLKKTRIDIWHIRLHVENSIEASMLSEEEQQRAERFYFKRHQRRYINAHSALRLILSRYLGIAPEGLIFHAGVKGKPRVDNAVGLEFNLSHSKDTALLAVGHTYPLGIDVEHFSSRPYCGIGGHLFSEKENQLINAVIPSLQPLAFFNIWSQKEALIKACGLGLSYPTQSFDVPIFSQSSQTIVDALHQRTWQMKTFMPSVGCCAALCYDENVSEIRYFPTAFERLNE